MVGAIVRIDGQVTAHRIIRDDILDCLYGKTAGGARNLIDFALNDLKTVAEHRGPEAIASVTSGGLSSGDFHATGQDNLGDALRTAALMYSSMVALDRLDELEAEDNPQPDEVNRQFASEVREYVTPRRPDLAPYFGRTAVLMEGGAPVKFGICSPKAVMHFGTLHPVRQAAGMRDARARLWELHRVREFAGIQTAGLVVASPRLDDVTLSIRQREAARRNLDEIEREADSYEMRFFPVISVPEAGNIVIEHAG